MMRAALPLLLLLATVSASAFGLSDQGAPCQAVASVTVPQRSYAVLNVPAFDQRVYLYAPDIKTSWGGGFGAFTLWVVEGVYGKPFAQPTGAMEESAFEQIRTSRNVMATPVPVGKDGGRKQTPFTIGKERFVLDLVKVNTSLGGTDSVTVNVCR